MERALKVETCKYDFTCIIFNILGVVLSIIYALAIEEIIVGEVKKNILVAICVVECVSWTYLNCLILRDVLFIIKMLTDCDFFGEEYQKGSEESYE